ncbi:hypothetical protein ACIQI8_27490 [Streptomyces sp. NPDC092369]|uniref:hypothetical protein n=1 Tax=Streptomyces sp. NPDC092369 TaxID=3366015 RepID=UPI00381471D5
MGRRQRRARQRQVVKQLLDGPPKDRVCGQAKAAARARARTTGPQAPKLPKSEAQQLARQRQAATGRPYTVCLAEVRAEHAGRDNGADGGAGR